MMYASCPQYVDEVGRGNLTLADEAEVLEKLPAFDANTPRAARDNGALVEMFRTYPGARVNQHVARFVARGRQADLLVSPGPFAAAPFAGGLPVGVGHLLHGVDSDVHLGSHAVRRLKLALLSGTVRTPRALRGRTAASACRTAFREQQAVDRQLPSWHIDIHRSQWRE